MFPWLIAGGAAVWYNTRDKQTKRRIKNAARGLVKKVARRTAATVTNLLEEDNGDD